MEKIEGIQPIEPIAKIRPRLGRDERDRDRGNKPRKLVKKSSPNQEGLGKKIDIEV